MKSSIIQQIQNLLKSFCCSDVEAKLEQIEIEKEKLIQNLNDVKSELTKVSTQLNECESKKLHYQQKLEEFAKQIKFLNQKIEQLNKIKNFNYKNLLDINVKFEKTVDELRYIFDAPLFIYADWNYYATTLNEWKKILTPLQSFIFRKYKKSQFDCDDFALTMASAVVNYADAKNLGLQLAFGIAWSDTHAFNILWTNNECYIFEPQTGTIIGKANEVKADEYQIKKIFLLS